MKPTEKTRGKSLITKKMPSHDDFWDQQTSYAIGNACRVKRRDFADGSRWVVIATKNNRAAPDSKYQWNALTLSLWALKPLVVVLKDIYNEISAMEKQEKWE